MDSLSEVSTLGEEKLELWDAEKVRSPEGTVFDKVVKLAGFWLLTVVHFNQGWLFLRIFTSDVCLPMNVKENHRWLHKAADTVSQNSYYTDTINTIMYQQVGYKIMN